MAKAVKRKQKQSPKKTDKAQYARFVETARKLEVDESEESFERAFTAIVPQRKSGSGKRP